MGDKSDEKQSEIGIGSLPRKWAVVVQLVGTFGLAVFLVLYYVLVMYPQETARYQNLESEVRNLMAAVERQQTLLSGEQADRIEELFVSAVSSEFCIRSVEGIEQGWPSERIAESLERALDVKIDLLRGLTRRDGRQVSEMLTNKVRIGELGARTISDMGGVWKDMDLTDKLRACQRLLDESLSRLRSAK